MSNAKFQEFCLNEKGRPDCRRLVSYLIETKDFANYDGRLFHYAGDAIGAWLDVTKDMPNKAVHQYIPPEYQEEVGASLTKRIVADLIASPKIVKEFADDPDVLNVENGVLDLRNMQMRQHDRKFGLRYLRKFKYEAGADISKAKSFCAYLTSSLGCKGIESDEFKVVMEALGYVISEKRDAKKAIFLLGDSNVGKSQLLKLLEMTFAPKEVSGVGLHELTSVFRFSALGSSKVNILHEIKPVSIKGVDEFKKIVSGEPVIQEEKGKNPERIIPRTIFVSATNTMPEFAATELNNSLISRLLVIRFMGKISVEQINRNLLKELEQEKDIIFSAAIGYLRSLNSNKMVFTEPKATQAFMDAYAKSLNSIKVFVEECCDMQGSNKIFSCDLYNSYSKFAKKNMLFLHSSARFGLFIRSIAGVENKKIRIGAKALHGYIGIGLKREDFLA